MRTTVRHGAIVRCDIGEGKQQCDARFVTYSQVKMARPQAARDGWGRLKLNMLADWQELGRGSNGAVKLDACPACTALVMRDHAARQAQKLKDRAAKKAAKGTTKRLAHQPTKAMAAKATAAPA